MPDKIFTSRHIGLVLLTVITITWLFNRRRRWSRVGVLTNIYMYPLKSGKFKELPEAECTSLGLKYTSEDGKVSLRDRVFVVYEEDSMDFIIGKNHPKITQITVSPKTQNSVVFTYPGKRDIEVILPEKFDESFVGLWNPERVRTVDCGNEIAQWVSEIIFDEVKGLRVGYWPENETWRRNIESLRTKEMSVFKKLSNNFTGAYSDLSSYLLINSNSVQELNDRLEDSDKCSPLNFRPNLVIEGVEAYAEDKWDWIKIGEAVFRTFRPCTRCRFTTINPNTGERNEKNEPITTLKTYRTMAMLGEKRVDANIPVMGVYIGLIQPGLIQPGDPVFIAN